MTRYTVIQGTKVYYEDQGDGLLCWYDGSPATWYPYKGGAWVRDQQVEGTLDVKAPRKPSRHRAFVRREHAGC